MRLLRLVRFRRLRSKMRTLIARIRTAPLENAYPYRENTYRYPPTRTRSQALVLSALALLFVLLWRSPPPRAEAAVRASNGTREYAWSTP